MGSDAASSELAGYLNQRMGEWGLTQNQLAVSADVGQATISEILNKGYIPKVETLFRLADYLGIPREQILRLAGHLPPAGAAQDPPDPLEQALLAAFRNLPDPVKPIALDQLRLLARLPSDLPPDGVPEA